jgi:hypothetical protein
MPSGKSRNRVNPDGSRRVGKPPMLTPEVQQAIVDLVRVGNFPQVAAEYHGISRFSLWEWMARGENPDHPRNVASGEDTTIYVEFAKAVREAEARSQAVVLVNLIREAREDAGVATRFLERRFRRLWGVNALEVSGPDGGPVQVQTIGTILEDHEKQVLRDLILAELARREAEEKVEA